MKKVLFAIILFFTAQPLFSQNVTVLGNNYFMLAVNSTYFNYARATHYGDQHQTMWCWAACCQMILNFHGLNVTQEQIVYRCFQRLENAPGGEKEMFIALSGTAPNIWGRISGIGTESIEIGTDQELIAIKNELEHNRPLAVGLNNPGQDVGHENVISGITFSNIYDAYGNVVNFQIRSVILRDPWPGSPSRNEISWSEFASRANSLNTVYVDYR